jgi:hypothetical protein
VSIKYMGIEKSIKGDTNLVIRELFKFFSDIFPSFELIRKLTLSIDLEQLLKACQKIFAITEEGLITIAQTEKLSDKELLLLHLARSKLGYHLGKSDRDSIFISDLLTATKRAPGTIAGRLSELTSESFVDRVGKGEYKITTFGLDHFKNEILPKLRKEVK